MPTTDYLLNPHAYYTSYLVCACSDNSSDIKSLNFAVIYQDKYTLCQT